MTASPSPCLAGRISDALIAKDPAGGHCGKRVQVRRFPKVPVMKEGQLLHSNLRYRPYP